MSVNQHNKASGSKQTASLLALSSVPLIMTLGNSMLIPVLPAIEEALDITSLQASLIITVYSVMAIILIPIAGYLSDRVGRKKVIIPSLISGRSGRRHMRLGGRIVLPCLRDHFGGQSAAGDWCGGSDAHRTAARGGSLPK